MENNNNKISLPSAIIVAGFLIMLGFIINKNQGPANKFNAGEFKSKYADLSFAKQNNIAPVTSSDHIRGDLSKAEVVIVEFSDTECPFCKNFHFSMQKAMEKYGDRVAWVYRHYPLNRHQKAIPEAIATECAAYVGGNEAFWKYLDKIFIETPSNDGLDLELISVFAEQVGINKQKFEDCLKNDSAKLVERVKANMADGSNIGLKGTPLSIIQDKSGKTYRIEGANEEGLFNTLESLLK